MDTKLNCFKCKQNYKNQTPLSCKHLLCQKCLLRSLLKRNMLELPDKDTIIVPCKCKNGQIELTLQKITEIINTPNDLQSVKCEKHSLETKCFCKKCSKYLCEKCLESHNDLFSDHKLVNASEMKNFIENEKEQCPKHFKDYEAYCKTCKVSLCQVCRYDSKTHEGHVIIMYKEYQDKIADQVQKLQFPSFDSFSNNIKKLETQFDVDYNKNLNKTKQSLESVLSIIKTALGDYNNKMDIKKKKKDLVMGIIKKVYENYYKDIRTIQNTNNLLLLKFLSKSYSEFSELNFRSDFDEVIQKLKGVENLLKKEEVENYIKVSYSYFAKKELKLANQILKKHKDQVNCVIELKDGRILSASEDNTICVFDDNGNNTHILEGHLSAVRSLCGLRKNKFASGSVDKTIRIWDARQYKTLSILKEHSNPVIHLTLIGELLASCSFREIIVYESNLKPKYDLKVEHTSWIRDLVQLDNNKVATCGDEGVIKIWDKHFRCLNTLKDHSEPVLSLCKLRDGRLISGDRSGKMIVWSRGFGFSRENSQHTGAVLAIVQIKDGRIVTGSSDKSIRIWDLDFKGLFVFNNHLGNVNSLYPLSDGGLVSGGADCNIFIWR